MFNRLLSDQRQYAWAAVAGAVISVGAGVIKGAQAKKAQKNAMARRTPYKTPQELIEATNAAKAMATTGFSPETLNYYTNQNDRAFNSSLQATQQLGGDANQAAALFDQKFQNIYKIGQENTLLNLNNWSKFLDSQKYLAGSMDAEWASREGMIKDQQAAAQQNRLEATAQISNGINTGIAAYSNYKVGQLYTTPANANVPQETFQPLAVTNSRTGLDTQLPG